MASKAAVAMALATLAEVRPREITELTANVYAAALRDVDDVALGRAVQRALEELKFFPAPSELRDFAGANRVEGVDIEALCRAIWMLAWESPAIGAVAPRGEAVRAAFGESVGDAYAFIGGPRLFSGNETTRDIARREFAAELREGMRTRAERVLPPPDEQARAFLAAPGLGLKAVRSGPQPIAKLLTRGEG